MSTIVKVYYNGYQIDIVKNISYTTNMVYKNDLVSSYYYTITLQGVCVNNADFSSYTAGIPQSIKNIKDIFSSNGSRLVVKQDNRTILFALNSKIQSLNFDVSSDNWKYTVPFTAIIDFSHLHMGTNLDSSLSPAEKLGYDEVGLADNFASPAIRDLENYKIKTFEESFNLDITDDTTDILTLIKPIINHDYTTLPGISENYITNSRFNINYTLSAVGQHHVIYNAPSDANVIKGTMPAWEHAKRWVHTKLSEQINSMFASFMSNQFPSDLKDNYAKTGDGIFNAQSADVTSRGFGLFNENYIIDVSESDGKYSVQYSALVKQRCPATAYSLGCSDNTIHTIKKSFNKQFVANEETNLENQEIVVNIDGTIQGLMPSNLANGAKISPLFIDNPYDNLNKGTFLVRQNTIYDRNDFADQLLSTIFDPVTYDFTEPFKRALGLTPDIFGVNNDVVLRPSKMNLTRNFLEGIINYSAEYDNKYNCLETHFETTLSVDMPVPIIAEFVIPNNNYTDRFTGEICGSGFSVIQKLGTSTAKKISVNINGNPGFDLGKCCIGNFNPLNGCVGNLDIFQLSYFSLADFNIPSGVVIPTIGDNYVLTNKQKTMNFPKGDFNITLEYICADVCTNEYLEN